MDLQHSKSYAALTQQSSQLFKPKQLSFKQQMGIQQDQQSSIVAYADSQIIDTGTYDANNDRIPYLNQQLYSFKSYRISTEMINGSPIDQIQLILRENENLKRSLNQKQQIIESLNRSRKVKPRLDFSDFKKNSRSLVQPQSQQESIKPKNVEIKQSISQNYNKRIKLPKIEDSIPTKEDECNFTFANNFFNNNTCKNQKINFKQVFTQSHLKKKFFT
ncbi:unnamed protein product (macronuclear) [Paramecium tetraurelia]|uniref:Uncharacterized protein n=1 Tax=Paramecium tetraurelia TaxID=5888 RepID=A0CEI9_PARTE|nr:uncharacterized protein GSPATT00037644001 [Paramecium tetraurelia]CAK69206.1 unnamed protein product [Paramecium tetraurelia]|eukprot:XP_001436603.1 hypothetical protein (macronuclear) [Paramecium tetraurelia strain d4-2]